jgi:hypothetical protein
MRSRCAALSEITMLTTGKQSIHLGLKVKHSLITHTALGCSLYSANKFPSRDMFAYYSLLSDRSG